MIREFLASNIFGRRIHVSNNPKEIEKSGFVSKLYGN
jgi:hypothetical protein